MHCQVPFYSDCDEVHVISQAGPKKGNTEPSVRYHDTIYVINRYKVSKQVWLPVS
jgi:hypothetical protein